MTIHSAESPAALRVLMNVSTQQSAPRSMEFAVRLPDGSQQSLLHTTDFLVAMPAGAAGSRSEGNILHGRWGDGATASADLGLKLLPSNFRMQQVRSFMHIDDRCYMFFGGYHSGAGRCGNGNGVGSTRSTAKQSAAERAAAASELGELAPRHCFWCGDSAMLGYEGGWAFGRASAVSGMERRWCGTCFYQLGQQPANFTPEHWSERPFNICGEQGCVGCCDPEAVPAGDTDAADDPAAAATAAAPKPKPRGRAAHKKMAFRGWGRNKKSVNAGRSGTGKGRPKGK